MFVCSASASEFEVIFSSLGLMLSVIATRADDLPVINDSEAFQYVGKAIEVRGLVLAVPISPLGTAFINFGREYPIRRSPGSLLAPKKA